MAHGALSLLIWSHPHGTCRSHVWGVAIMNNTITVIEFITYIRDTSTPGLTRRSTCRIQNKKGSRQRIWSGTVLQSTVSTNQKTYIRQVVYPRPSKPQGDSIAKPENTPAKYAYFSMWMVSDEDIGLFPIERDYSSAVKFTNWRWSDR